MVEFFLELNPIFQALIACSFTFFLTSCGAACVFLIREIKEEIYGILLSISAGIMLASSIFSLIIPALNSINDLNINGALILSIGLFMGTLIIFIYDIVNKRNKKGEKNLKNLVISMTIHNLPEGMAIGVAFASVFFNNSINLMGAVSLAIGIGIQNFPEGSAISFPLYCNGVSKFKSFMIGSLSAIVEPIGGVLGVIIALQLPSLLPFFLSLAAGSMIYVIITELIPDIMAKKNKELMALYLIIGFILMMILDISLG